MTLITGTIGLIMLAMFLGILVWWIKAIPFTIIVVVVVALGIYEFVQALRHGESRF